MTVDEIYHYMRLSETLSSSGMPTAEQMNAIAATGTQVVINLAPHDVPNALADEGELVTALGMEYLNFPVIWRAPEQQTLVHFMDAMDARQDRNIHVHCEANYRASAFIMLYRVLRLGWKREDAIPVMEKMWNPEDFPVWDAFIAEQLKQP